MRERAQAATPGPWIADQSEIYRDHGVGDWVAETLNTDGHYITEANSAHIASWHPTVALAVADWFDIHGGGLERAGARGIGFCDSPADTMQALAVARAYLGEEADRAS